MTPNLVDTTFGLFTITQAVTLGRCLHHPDTTATPHQGDETFKVPYCAACKREHRRRNGHRDE
jgi:hypothetical protein